MATRPRVGFTLRPVVSQSGSDYLGQSRADSDAIVAVGGIPVGIPPLADPDALALLYRELDAIVLPGGPDLDPSHYGEATDSACCVETEAEIDAADLSLARWAIRDDRPLLGVCRGMQVMVVASGGSLWQDLGLRMPGGRNHRLAESERHTVELNSGRLAEVLGPTAIEVNSLHHQGVRRLGDGVIVAGVADDGLAEAIEIEARRFAVGVQWHPERMIHDAEHARRLFAALVTEAASR